jgi:hypothetical protein
MRSSARPPQSAGSYGGRHAASREICIGEAQDADDMAKHGAVVGQIRKAPQARYGSHTEPAITFSEVSA